MFCAIISQKAQVSESLENNIFVTEVPDLYSEEGVVTILCDQNAYMCICINNFEVAH